jgi:DNA-binding Xre family transcriptional regulator
LKGKPEEKTMTSTFDEFISDPKRKEEFDKEYNEFLLSEFVLEKKKKKKISVRTLAKRAGVSPTIIQKIRSKGAERINFRTFTTVLNTLGYKISIERI